MSIQGIVSVYLLHAVSIMLLCRSKYNRRKTIKICAAMAAAQMGVAFWADLYLKGAVWVYLVFIITFAILMVEIFWLSAEGVAKTLFFCMTYVQIFLVVAYMAGMLGNWLFDSHIGATAYLRALLHVVLLAVYVRFLRDKFEIVRQEVTKGWWPMCILSILYTIYISSVVMRAQADYFRGVEILPFFLLLAAILAGYWVIFNTIYYMRKSALQSKIELQEKILMQKLEIMEDVERETRRKRHDFRHHMLNIAEFARNGQMEELLVYLDKYYVEVEDTESLFLCANSTINHILTVYISQAKKKGIRVTCDVSVKEEIGINDVDLVAILGNLLENSVHGCLEAGKEEMYILVRIQMKAQKFSVLVENTCRENIHFENGLPKAEGREGIGVSSIVKSVEKYGGAIDFGCRDGRFVSRAVMLMQS